VDDTGHRPDHQPSALSTLLTSLEFTVTIDLSEVPSVACEAVRAAYPDCPSVGRLMLEAVALHHTWRGAAEHPDHHPSAFLREHERTFWVLTGVALDIVALQSPQDLHSGQQAARAGQQASRLADGTGLLSTDAARAYLRDAYQETRSGDRHTWNCPGGCGGAGWTLQVATQEHQGPGLWVPVYQEPVDCDRGLSLEHTADCPGGCRGSGWTTRYHDSGYPSERDLCSGIQRWRGPSDQDAAPDWDEPPF
jgi:hypothetical protein